MSASGVDLKKRRVLTAAATVVGAVGAGFVAVPFIASMQPSARAKAAGLTTKSGFMLGLGETGDEIEGLLADLADVGVDIVTIGQYLRPTSNHLPVVRFAEPAEFERWKGVGEALGIGHVEAGRRCFRHLCDEQALEPENTYFDRLAHYLGNDIHCPVHYKARLDAGFTSSELHRLERLCTRR